jgi:hypothetical protein
MQTVTSLKSVKAHQKQWFMLNQPNCAEPCQTPVKPPFTAVTGDANYFSGSCSLPSAVSLFFFLCAGRLGFER